MKRVEALTAVSVTARTPALLKAIRALPSPRLSRRTGTTAQPLRLCTRSIGAGAVAADGPATETRSCPLPADGGRLDHHVARRHVVDLQGGPPCGGAGRDRPPLGRPRRRPGPALGIGATGGGVGGGVGTEHPGEAAALGQHLRHRLGRVVVPGAAELPGPVPDLAHDAATVLVC